MTRRSFLASSLLLRSPANLCWVSTSIDGSAGSVNWPGLETAVSVGSILKPFLALAYLATHASAPVLNCSGCWLPSGHGRQDLSAALANSCNTYFLHLAAELNRAALDRICLQFDLIAPARDWSAARLIGLGEGWPQTPSRLVRAFGTLGRDIVSAPQPVLAGMQRCAFTGTARALGFPCYAKTGTGVCCHSPSGAGDGYIVVLFPLGSPRHVLLVQQHNTTGAHAAESVVLLLKTIG
ncbi:MAG: hypothetical protein JO061_06275 [Acidobacteriaceae bacterium]|nr:hypothetical protein [Acidobacteriaceae bacterium]